MAIQFGPIAGELPADAFPSVIIYGDGAVALSAFVDEIISADSEMRVVVGARAIRDAVAQFAQRCNAEGERPAELVAAVRHAILKPLKDAIQTRTVFVPINNLEIEGELDLGMGQIMSRSAVMQATKDFISSAQKASTTPRPTDIPPFEHWEAWVTSTMQGLPPPCLRIEVRSHKAAAQERAQAIAIEAMNILRAFLQFCCSADKKQFPYITGETGCAHFQTASFDLVDRAFETQSLVVGPQMPAVLSADVIKHLEDNCAFGVMRDILAKPAQDRNTFEHALVSAAECLGRSSIAPTRHQAVVDAVTAIERLVVSENDTSTTEKFELRLSHLIGENGVMRRIISKRAKELYEVRSCVVHAGRTEVPGDDVATIRAFAGIALVQGLKAHGSFSAHKSFCDELHDRRLGS
jgi:hypothetical protein